MDKEQLLDQIDDYFANHLSLIKDLGKIKKRDTLLFRFVMLSTVQNQLQRCQDEKRIQTLSALAIAVMEELDEALRD